MYVCGLKEVVEDGKREDGMFVDDGAHAEEDGLACHQSSTAFVDRSLLRKIKRDK